MDKWLKELLCYALSNVQSLNIIHAWIIQHSLELDMVMNSLFLYVAACVLLHMDGNLESGLHGYSAVFGETIIMSN